jgi:hypothetical protein
MTYFRVLVIIAALGACATKQPERVVTGRVLHPDRGPLPGVKVATVDPVPIRVVTDSDGRYELQGRFQTGCRQLRIESPGFDMVTRTFGVAQVDTINLDDITLHYASPDPVTQMYVDCASPTPDFDAFPRGFNPRWVLDSMSNDP